jgi:hypothetical protein
VISPTGSAGRRSGAGPRPWRDARRGQFQAVQQGRVQAAGLARLQVLAVLGGQGRGGGLDGGGDGGQGGVLGAGVGGGHGAGGGARLLAHLLHVGGDVEIQAVCFCVHGFSCS